MENDLAINALTNLSNKLLARAQNMNADSEMARLLRIIADDIDRSLIDAGYRFKQ